MASQNILLGHGRLNFVLSRWLSDSAYSTLFIKCFSVAVSSRQLPSRSRQKRRVRYLEPAIKKRLDLVIMHAAMSGQHGVFQYAKEASGLSREKATESSNCPISMEPEHCGSFLFNTARVTRLHGIEEFSLPDRHFLPRRPQLKLLLSVISLPSALSLSNIKRVVTCLLRESANGIAMDLLDKSNYRFLPAWHLIIRRAIIFYVKLVSERCCP